MDDADWVPLFPLKTVLFPGGVLPLRVFETRYVDMVRTCMKSGTPFGVVAIRNGSEVGNAAEPYAVGTFAHIVDWDMADLGVLLLNTRGGERFRILDMRTRPNQLIEARTAPLPDDHAPGDVPDRADDALPVCANVLRVVIDDLLQRASDDTDDGFISPFPEPHCLDDAGWVANRWGEMLPISLDEKQQLLEIPDPASRLKKVAQYLQENGVI